MRRWRLVLGGGDADGTGAALDGDDGRIDAALGALYDAPARRRAGGRPATRSHRRAAGSAVRRRRWHAGSATSAGTSRSPVVQVLQRDAIERLDLRQLLLEPEMLEAVEPDLHLVTLLVELNRAAARRRRGPPRAPSSPGC